MTEADRREYLEIIAGLHTAATKALADLGQVWCAHRNGVRDAYSFDEDVADLVDELASVRAGLHDLTTFLSEPAHARAEAEEMTQ